MKKQSPKHVLYFVDRMRHGGIQSLVLNWAIELRKRNILVDFLVLDDGNTYGLEDTIRENDFILYKLKNIWIRTPIDYIRQAKALKGFFEEHHDYSAVHMHSSSKNYLVLKYAKKSGIKTRIAHSHTTNFQSGSRIKSIVGNALKHSMKKYSTNYFACSEEAGKWLFGEKIVNSDAFTIVKNGIDYNRFKYNALNRENIRNKYNIKKNDYVIGHIGRFVPVKNQAFLLDVLKILGDSKRSYKVLFVGDGEMKESVIQAARDKNVDKKVIFAGYQPNTDEYLSAFDCFAMPSIYEGLCLALIEAQANGLTCLATKDTIPNDVKILDNFTFMQLDPLEWAKRIDTLDLHRVDSKNDIKACGYTIEESADILAKYY